MNQKLILLIKLLLNFYMFKSLLILKIIHFNNRETRYDQFK